MDTSTYLTVSRVEGLPENAPAHAEADGIDLVVVRRSDAVHVFEGRCPHRGALLADGRVEGSNLICGVHGWDYRLDTGISAYNPAERIHKFTTLVVDGEVLLDKAELLRYREMRPERAVTSTYDRLFDDPHQDTAEEPFVSEIHALARNGLEGAHGAVAAMGVPRTELPTWDDLQVLTAQLHRFPLLDDEAVDTAVTIGPAAACSPHGSSWEIRAHSTNERSNVFTLRLASLGEIVAFLVLGLTVDLTVVARPDVWIPGLVLGVGLAVIIRPKAAGLCLLPATCARTSWRSSCSPASKVLYPSCSASSSVQLTYRKPNASTGSSSWS